MTAVLTGCEVTNPARGPVVMQAVPAQTRPQAGPEVIGGGGTHVALLLPRSAAGNGGMVALAFRNAAELALRDFPGGDQASSVEIRVYDTKGTPAGAQAAAAAALAGDARVVLGPLFSAEVAAVAPPARQAGLPLVAFSSDASVAAPGVYLLSFTPGDDAARIVSYAVGQGRRSLAALVPGNTYGAVAEAAFRRAAARAGATVAAIETYRPDGADVAARAAAIVAIAGRVDALFVPEPAQARAAAAALAEAGVTRDRLKLLGSGSWNTAATLAQPALAGSWFPAPADAGFRGFAAAYRAAYRAPPPRNATLAYDAVVLAAGLSRRFGDDAFTAATFGNPKGFNGVDGAFRFSAEGVAERLLAVYELTGGPEPLLVAPAETSFAPPPA